METLDVISNKKRQWVKRVQWLRNVHDTPKNNLSSTAADTFGTPISNSVSKWIRSFLHIRLCRWWQPIATFWVMPTVSIDPCYFWPRSPLICWNHESWMLKVFRFSTMEPKVQELSKQCNNDGRAIPRTLLVRGVWTNAPFSKTS